MSTVSLAQYLFVRLQQLGVGSVFGVPGDFNLTLLDYVSALGLNWVGNANELNAGYAADGYARSKGIAALVTTFGVGELSAINAIAGAYAEHSPVVHIVGTPSTEQQRAQICLHHSLGDGDLRRFSRIHTEITVAQVNLIDPTIAAVEIDKALKRCLDECRPIYIEVPTDMVEEQIPGIPLDTPLMAVDTVPLSQVEEQILMSRFRSAKQPLLIIDGLATRYKISSEVNHLVAASGFPCVTTPFGKGIVDESLPDFYGVYSGAVCESIPVAWFEASDVVIKIGPLDSNINTLGFTTLPATNHTITICKDSIDICGEVTFQNLNVKLALQQITELIKGHRVEQHNLPIPIIPPKLLALPEPQERIIQASFYHHISRFFRPHDIILADTGTVSVGAREFLLLHPASLITSPIWLSIGSMLPSAQGTALTLRELTSSKAQSGGRTILFQGDGAFQMTVQSISDIVRNKLNVIIFLINNEGYTIERLIHGARAEYNNVQPWRYRDAARFFGAPIDDPEYPVVTERICNGGQLRALCEREDVTQLKGFWMFEVLMDKDDATESLKKLTGWSH